MLKKDNLNLVNINNLVKRYDSKATVEKNNKDIMIRSFYKAPEIYMELIQEGEDCYMPSENTITVCKAGHKHIIIKY